jgi:nitroreductase
MPDSNAWATGLIQIMANGSWRTEGLRRLGWSEDSMDILEAIHGRRAVRDYADEKPSDAVVGALLDAAVWAPSGINLQPWCFFVVDDRARLAAFSDEAKALMLGQANADGAQAREMREMLASPQFNIFYNAPVLIVICSTTPDEMAIKDCCLAAQTLMLAAYGQGLGSCWIGFAEAWLKTPAGKARLGIPAEFTPVAPIILGYPKGPVPAAERRAPDIRRLVSGSS